MVLSWWERVLVDPDILEMVGSQSGELPAGDRNLVHDAQSNLKGVPAHLASDFRRFPPQDGSNEGTDFIIQGIAFRKADLFSFHTGYDGVRLALCLVNQGDFVIGKID